MSQPTAKALAAFMEQRGWSDLQASVAIHAETGILVSPRTIMRFRQEETPPRARTMLAITRFLEAQAPRKARAAAR
jgi:hypothetical protein